MKTGLIVAPRDLERQPRATPDDASLGVRKRMTPSPQQRPQSHSEFHSRCHKRDAGTLKGDEEETRVHKLFIFIQYGDILNLKFHFTNENDIFMETIPSSEKVKHARSTVNMGFSDQMTYAQYFL